MRRFVDNGNGTVTDNETGLMWQQETALCACTWHGALQYCKDMRLAGFDDWRLPTIQELQSLVDYKRVDPAIDPVFSDVSSWAWSATEYAALHKSAWFLDFYNGQTGAASYARGYVVRAVRGGE